LNSLKKISKKGEMKVTSARRKKVFSSHFPAPPRGGGSGGS